MLANECRRCDDWMIPDWGMLKSCKVLVSNELPILTETFQKA
jgi:hypothetical protein